MTNFDYVHSVLACACDDEAAELAIDGLDRCKEHLDRIGAFQTGGRVAALIGQTAHESSGFARLVENLNYSVGGLQATFGRHRITAAQCREYGRSSAHRANREAIANTVYGGAWGRKNLGNTQPGDGWRYRGRGWLQLTGRGNYRIFARILGLDLEDDPGQATDPKVAWLIAAYFLNTRSRLSRTAFEWADRGDVDQVTRIINGGTNGLEDRRILTNRALMALEEPEVVTSTEAGIG